MSGSPAVVIPPNRLAARWVIGLSWLYLFGLGLVCWLVFIVSESHWIGSVLTYAPRQPYLAPALALLAASVFWHRPSVFVNAFSLWMVLGPIMGLNAPLGRAFSTNPVGGDQKSIRIVSCNVQAFRPNFGKVLEEIDAIDPDVVALQEAFPVSPVLEKRFAHWNTISDDRYWVGSKYPLRMLNRCDAPMFERTSGITVEVQAPGGSFVLADIHQMTARKGLTELSKSSLINGDGVLQLSEFNLRREEETVTIRESIEKVLRKKPLVVVGDFNTPVTSQFFIRHWSDLQSAFDVAGMGYGYTSPCKNYEYWPKNTPWARIDHILCSRDWEIHSCRIGQSAGSDHRLITATISLGKK